MTIRLRIAGPGGLAVPFESAAPTIRVGRDPACELALEGESSAGVSREHARIDRTPSGGATVAPLSLTNATLLNDKPIETTLPLRTGDRIQLGYTGPFVEVISIVPLPVAAPAPAITPQSTQSLPPTENRVKPWPFIVGGAALIGVLVVGAVIAVFALKRPAAVATPTKTDDLTLAATPSTSRPATTAATTTVIAPNVPPPPVIVGLSVPHPDRLPSVLLQQLGDLYPWAPLGAYQRVRTGLPLLALPGYRSAIELDSKVQITLSGNLPLFDESAAVLESVIVCNPPADNFDADLSLERGRIRIANHKPSGPARVRIQFGSRKWDVTLPSANSQVGLEWTIDPARVTTAGRQTLARYRMRMIASGGVQLSAGNEEIRLPQPQGEVVWAEGMPDRPTAQPLDKLPAWWNDKPDLAKMPADRRAEMEEAWIGLAEWANWLTKAESPVYTVRAKVREEKDNPMARSLGLFFLPALDAPRDLIDFLEDPQLESGPFHELRDAGFHALRLWVNRDSQHPESLAKNLRKDKSYPVSAAQDVTDLLQWRAQSEIQNPARAARVALLLDSDSLLVRTLAHMELTWSVKLDVRKQHNYDPSAKPADRAKAAAAWQTAVGARRQ